MVENSNTPRKGRMGGKERASAVIATQPFQLSIDISCPNRRNKFRKIVCVQGVG